MSNRRNSYEIPLRGRTSGGTEIANSACFDVQDVERVESIAVSVNIRTSLMPNLERKLNEFADNTHQSGPDGPARLEN